MSLRDGWSCGLWCLQFAEEAVRQHRGEPLIVPVPVVHAIMARVNKFVDSIGQYRPAEHDSAASSAASSAAPKNSHLHTASSAAQNSSDLHTLATELEAASEEQKNRPVRTSVVIKVEEPRSAVYVPPATPPPPVRLPSEATTGKQYLESLPPELRGSGASASEAPPAIQPPVSGASASLGPAPCGPPMGPAPGPPLEEASAPVAPPPSTSATTETSGASAASEPEFTAEMAWKAKDSCSKCRRQGCAQCMKQFFISRRAYRQLSRADW